LTYPYSPNNADRDFKGGNFKIFFSGESNPLQATSRVMDSPLILNRGKSSYFHSGENSKAQTIHSGTP
jgi:hypothetical protein